MHSEFRTGDAPVSGGDGARVRSNEGSCSVCRILRYEGGSFEACEDSVIQEYALDIFLNGALYRSLTCSPWDIEALTAGVLFLDGVISCGADIESMAFDIAAGRIDVSVGDAHGVRRIGSGDLSLTPEQVIECIGALESGSLLFHKTGGVHSAVLMDSHGVIEAWFEDIGRHSAVDKLVGWGILNDIDPLDKVLVFSGRVPHEIISKVVAVGWPLVISPGAPTTLSIATAQEGGTTLVGFAKPHRFNVYSHAERIALPSA